MQNFDFRRASQEERTAFTTADDARNKAATDGIKALLTAEQKAKAEKLAAGAAELRTTLGIGARGGANQPPPPGGNPPGNVRPGRGNNQPGGPNSNSWQPGQGAGAQNNGQTPAGSFPVTDEE
jgi:hypothetical protein